MAWLSAHLHFPGVLYGRDGDRVILEVVEPFVALGLRDGSLGGYFFVRYTSDGPHIRLRFRGPTPEAGETLRVALMEHARSTAVAPVIRWSTYEPELDRYGGTEAIVVAERYFEASSRAALGLLRTLDSSDRTARLGKTLLAVLVLLHTFTRDIDRIAALARQYRRANLYSFARAEHQDAKWLEAFDAGYDRQATTLAAFIAEAWQRLEGEQSLYAELDNYRQDLLPVRESLARLCSEGCVRYNGTHVADLDHACSLIIPSYIHMTNNRLGITIREEAYLSYLIERVQREMGRPSPAVIA